jgi:hypothetical protein
MRIIAILRAALGVAAAMITLTVIAAVTFALAIWAAAATVVP